MKVDFRYRRVLCLGLALPLLTMHPANAHEISFDQAVNMAWANDPARKDLNTNRASAFARADAAKSWFSGGPVLNAQYYDDHYAGGSNIGYTTYQGGVSVPLWLPGQGTETEKLARADAENLRERLNVAHLAVSVKVLETAGALTLAQRRQSVALAQLKAMERISAAVTRSVKVGEGTSADAQATDAELANARSEVDLAAEAVTATQADLQELLGTADIPDLMAYVPPPVPTHPGGYGEDADPRVRAAMRAVKAAQENTHLARASFMPNPEIGVSAIHEEQYGSPWDTRLGVNVSIPLPSAVRNVPMMAAARDRMSAATRDEITARRMVRTELIRIRARLATAALARKEAELAAGSLNQRADALEHSWMLKETPLVEALRARRAAYQAIATYSQTEVEWRVAAIRMSIAYGAMQ
ncbi:TolC family protein [Gluconobacter wancherniae]|uniref:TolC family protein n=1 Tax=Gluconobacter wancherniae TaxID=1307955 RepID=UPI0020120661|nr:TolC family protein [Gluconobacter wancherniae]